MPTVLTADERSSISKKKTNKDNGKMAEKEGVKVGSFLPSFLMVMCDISVVIVVGDEVGGWLR